jgi:hypothetical protein
MAETTSSSAAGQARQELILTRIFGFLDRGTTTEVVMRALFPTAAACELAVEKHGATECGKQTLELLAEFVGWGTVKN